jgi:hypothetical protein
MSSLFTKIPTPFHFLKNICNPTITNGTQYLAVKETSFSLSPVNLNTSMENSGIAIISFPLQRLEQEIPYYKI